MLSDEQVTGSSLKEGAPSLFSPALPQTQHTARHVLGIQYTVNTWVGGWRDGGHGMKFFEGVDDTDGRDCAPGGRGDGHVGVVL